MSTRRTPTRLALAALLVPLVLGACKGNEKPAAQATAAPPPSPTLVPPPPPTAAPTPPPVWRAARWGMTKEEVLAAFPGEAEKLPQAASFSQPQPGSGLTAASGDVVIPAFEAHDGRFRVHFGFAAGDTLDRVQLEGIKAGPHTCEDLEAELTTDHSAPSQRGSIGTSLRGEEIVWRKPDQTITLACTGVAKLGFQTVTLDYTAPRKELAGQ